MSKPKQIEGVSKKLISVAFREQGYGDCTECLLNFNRDFLMKWVTLRHLRVQRATKELKKQGDVVLIREVNGDWLKPECIVGVYTDYFELMDAINRTPRWKEARDEQAQTD